LDDVTRDAILSALADWKVVYFRNAHITPEQQKAFGARFGERLCIRLRHTSRVFLKS
jgi:taurine dioxygenase